jgi:hypothetical protein
MPAPGIAALSFVPLLAQFLVDPTSRSMQAVRQILDSTPRGSLSCSIQSLPPRLGFSLVNWSGFNLIIPVNRDSPAFNYGIAIEITPKGGAPVYLAERLSFQPPPEGARLPRGAAAEYTGGFYAGPGEYRIRLRVGDERNSQCGKEWKIKVKPARIADRIEPNQILAVGDERWRGLATGGPPRHFTIVLEAGPLFPRRNMVRISSYDRSVLMTSLTTLLDTTRATGATIIAVDPRNRKIIYQSETFNRRERFRLARALAEVNLGVVSLETLKGPTAGDFMESVLDKVQPAAAKSEAVVFLGPIWSWQGKFTPRMRELAANLPRPHFFGLTRFPGLPDNLVAKVVKSANGSVKMLLTPEDFAKAIEKVAPEGPR